MTEDWCRTDIVRTGERVLLETALLGARVGAARLLMQRAVWAEPGAEFWLLVGPDDLEDVTTFMGVPVVRVEHWQGRPVVAATAGHNVASAYQMARVFQEGGIPADQLRAFGPPGWEHVSLPLMGGRQNNRVDFVPVTKLPGPMIGVELT